MRITQVEPLILGRSILVQIHTDEGIRGIGECSPMNAPVIAAHIEHSLTPLVIGEDPTRVEWLTEKLFAATYKIAGQTQAIAISGIELASWDIAGKAAVAMLHFAAVCPAARTPQEFSLAGITGEHHLVGLLREPDLTVRDGFLRVPDGPGLGIELDEEKLAALRQG